MNYIGHKSCSRKASVAARKERKIEQLVSLVRLKVGTLGVDRNRLKW